MQTFCFCVLAMLCASVASCHPPERAIFCLLPSDCLFAAIRSYPQPCRLKMPKRGRDSDDGVWVTVSQSPERSAMVQHPDALQLALPDALPAPAILMRCPYPVCSMCQWKVPPEQHSCYATIYAAYEALVRTLQDEVGLTAADKCRQSQLLNFQLQSMERLLFDGRDQSRRPVETDRTAADSSSGGRRMGHDRPPRHALRQGSGRPSSGKRSGCRRC